MTPFGKSIKNDFSLEEDLREAFRLGEAKDAATREKAIALYRKALKNQPGCYIAYFNLGVVQSRNGKWHDAIASFSEAQRSSEFRVLAAFAKLRLLVENGSQVADNDLPEEFRGEKRGMLGVQGPCLNAANELRNRGYSCSVEVRENSCSIISTIQSCKYTINLFSSKGILLKDVYREEQGKSTNIADLDHPNRNESDGIFAGLQVGRLPLIQAHISGAMDGATYSGLLSAAQRKLGPHGWVREGRSFEEVAAQQRSEAQRVGVTMIHTGSIEQIARSNCNPGNFLVCAFGGEPYAVVVLDRVHEKHVPVIRRALGACILRGEFFSMPEYPLVHLGLGVPVEFHGEKVSLSIVENLANFVEANFQDWVAALEVKKYTLIYVYGPDYSLVASGRRDVPEEIIKGILSAVEKANFSFQKTTQEKLSYRNAATKFFEQNPNPFIWSSK